jgi:hypothetical protein
MFKFLFSFIILFFIQPAFTENINVFEFTSDEFKTLIFKKVKG